MRSVMLLAMVTLALAGRAESAGAQAAKPKIQKTVHPKPAEPKVAVETAAAPVVAMVDTVHAADTTVHDTTVLDTTTHKKKGLFGKAKSVMKNKVVQQVVKVAACTMVPGGQVIAGAIDAAGSKSAGGAAAGAAGAASGSSCMPGMGGAGMAGAGMAGTGLAGMAAGGAAGGAARGMPQGYAMPAMGAPGAMPAGYGMAGDPTAMAECMGLTVDEYNAMTNPTNGEARAATKAEMKRMQQLSKKVGPQRQMGCSQQVGMQQANAQMVQMQQAMAQAQSAQPGAVTMSEAPGQPIALGDDLAADLKKGKATVRGIDWMAGAAEVSPAGKPAFDEAMSRLGAAIKASGQRYRLDIYMEERYDAAAVQAFGPGRLQQVQASLAAAVGDTAAIQLGKTKRDKNPPVHAPTRRS